MCGHSEQLHWLVVHITQKDERCFWAARDLLGPRASIWGVLVMVNK